MDSQASSHPVMCEVCGAYFETRRGLSSHARLHLRQLGVTLSENSGAPIELLYQLVQERDGSLPDFKSDSSVAGSAPATQTSQQESKTPSVQEDTNGSCKTEVRVTTTPQKIDHQGSPARRKETAASLLPSSPTALRPAEGSSSSSLPNQVRTKPIWAPLETDAPITLDTRGEVHVCQLCGCWYETRKGLSSHARAHLRQIGIPDGEVKGSPIDFLYRIMEEENVKPSSIKKKEDVQSNSSPGSSSKRPSDLSSPPASPLGKRPKTSEGCSCVLCGEAFENRKGLASHARSHLRHIGMSEIVGKSSAIDAVEDLVSSGMLEAVRIPKTNSTTSSSAAASPAPPSPAAPTRSPAPSQSWTPFSSTSFSPSPTKTPQSPQAPINRAPKAKKGFRLAVDPLHRKPKAEPVETDLSVHPKASSNSPIQKSPTALVSAKPLDSVMKSPPTVICEFCGQLFDTRKALSCHARAHLRQLGLTWSIKTSPIDLLREVMQSDEGKKDSASGKATWTSEGSKKSLDTPPSREPASSSITSPLDYSMKEKSPAGKSASSHVVPDTSCELCGFDFENRKALASHARAHLRQLGLFEWKADGATSPIELLSELIRRDRSKVEEITKRYRMGDLYIRKSHRPAASSSLSADTDFIPGGSLKSSSHQQEPKASSADSGITVGSSRHSQGHTRAMAGHGSPSVRSPRGVYPPKHGGPARSTNSRQPSRSGSIPALLPKPPLTPLVKLVGKIYSLKCRFCEEVFHGPLSVQEQWITHLQKHILSLGYKGKESPPAVPVTAPALVDPVAV